MKRLIGLAPIAFCLTLSLAAARTAGASASASLTVYDANYDGSRARFMALAKRVRDSNPGSAIRSIPVTAPGADGLFIDTIYLPATAGPARNLIVLVSGVHGVEGPAGSQIQRLLLDECVDGAIDRTRTAVLVIHALNPFGFKYGRRFNSANVDLNRNCFDSLAGGPFPGRTLENNDYESLRWLFEERPYVGLLDFLAAAALHGQETIRRSLRGQYKSARGIYYGGTEPQPECRAVQSFMRPYVESAQNIAFIDLHTGLGETSGLNQIMTNPRPRGGPESSAFDREVAVLKAMFPQSECRGLCEVQVGGEDYSFPTTGDVTQWLHTRYPRKRVQGTVVSVTAEIATGHERENLESVINENYCYWNRDLCGHDEYARRSREGRLMFSPESSAWRTQVERAGHQMCRAAARFSRLR